jgi:hypothetical protein
LNGAANPSPFFERQLMKFKFVTHSIQPEQKAQLRVHLPERFITAEFELVYSHSGCLKMLRRPGFEYRKPKALPRVADEDKQAEFIAFYQDLMTKLPADEAVYFADAVHPEHQTKPAFGWVRKGSNRCLSNKLSTDFMQRL